MNYIPLSPRQYRTKLTACINSICRAEADQDRGQGTEVEPDLRPEKGGRAAEESREADPDPGPADPDPDPGAEQTAIECREEAGATAKTGAETAEMHGLAGQRGTVDLRQGQQKQLGLLLGGDTADPDPDPDLHQAVALSLRMGVLLLTGHLGTAAGMVRARQAPAAHGREEARQGPAAPGMEEARRAPVAVPAVRSRIGFNGGAQRTRGRMTTAAETMRRRRRAGL